MEVKLSARALVGQQWKVKTTPITRKYGVRTGGAWAAKADCVAWPGEVGTVAEHTWTAASDGTPMSALFLEFSRGRQVSVDNADLADFLKVKS